MRALAFLVLASLLAGCFHAPAPVPPVADPTGPQPEAERLFSLARAQVLKDDGSVRFRVPGTEGAREAADWIAAELRRNGATARFHDFTATYRCSGPTSMRNVVGELPGTTNATIYLTAHYDTRPVAEKDPELARRNDPIPGANDGASGVAVVLELARLLNLTENRTYTYRFLLFDGEDGGSTGPLDGCGGKWALGSEAYAAEMNATDVANARALLLFDLVGDKNLELRKEGHTAAGPGKAIQERLWQIGDARGYGEVFRDLRSYEIVDDHVAFLSRGIAAVDVIHLDGGTDPFPSTHHTHADNLENLSAESLRIVSEVAWAWILEMEP